MKRRLALLGSLCLVIAAVVATASSATPVKRTIAPASAAVAKADVLPTKTASYLGVHEGDMPGSYRLTTTFKNAIGKWPNVVLYYSGWHEKFQTTFARTARNHGAVVLDDMNPSGITLRSICNGSQNAYLRSYAEQVKAFGHPVLISFAHEMNGNWYKWGWTHTSPTLFIDAWRHIVNLFRTVGADNVTWLWTVNTYLAKSATQPIKKWWPGSSYVNWVGIDGYITTTSSTFQNTFGNTLSQVRKLTKQPVFLAETAIGPQAKQAVKIPGLFDAVKQNKLLGLLWFDKDQNGSVMHQKWRLEGNKAGVNAFRASLKKYFNPLAR